MPELLVMRHAKSDWTVDASDFDRPLNGRGIAAAARMADWLTDENLAPDRIISSRAERARATALAVMYACSVPRAAVDFDDDFYLADAGTWLQALHRQTDARVLICGHNPGLDHLVEHLASELPALSHNGKLMTTAAIAHLRFDIEWSALASQTGELLQLVRPRELPD